MSDLEARITEVLAAHSIGAFSGDSTACQCDRTWRKNADHRKHLTEALAAALAPVVTEAKAEALRKAADKFQTGDWFNVIQGNAHVKIGNGQRVTDWLRARADKLDTL